MAIDAWTNRTQRVTRERATRNGEGWTSTELEFVTAFTGDVSDADLALALGRTLFAIQSIKNAITHGRTNGSTRTRVAASDRPYRGWMEGRGDE